MVADVGCGCAAEHSCAWGCKPRCGLAGIRLNLQCPPICSAPPHSLCPLLTSPPCSCGEALMAVAAAFPACTCHGYDIADDALG